MSDLDYRAHPRADTGDPYAPLDRIQRTAFIVGVVGLGVWLVSILFSREAFFRSYLVAFMFWLGVPLGSLGLLAIGHMAGGAWAAMIRRILEASTRMLLLMAVLFLPVLVGMKYLYVWSHDEAAHGGGHGPAHADASPSGVASGVAFAAPPAADAPAAPAAGASSSPAPAGAPDAEPASGTSNPGGQQPPPTEERTRSGAQTETGTAHAQPGSPAHSPERVPHGPGGHGESASAAGLTDTAGPDAGHGHLEGFKRAWLRPRFFILRAAVYFAIWIGIALLLNRWSNDEDRTGDRATSRRMSAFSAPAMILYILTMTGASVDWVMSIDPHWYSTIFGLLFVVGQGLSAMAVTICVIALLHDRAPLSGVITVQRINDLGNLLMAMTMLWAYLSFSQYLIIWAGNIAEETPFIFVRMNGGWQWMSLFLVTFHFFVPFLLLVWRRTKRSIKPLAAVALALIFMRWVDLTWVIMPAFQQVDPYGTGLGPIDPNRPPTIAMAFNFLWPVLFAVAGIGGVWVSLFIGQLKKRPILPPHDGRLVEVGHHHG